MRPVIGRRWAVYSSATGTVLIAGGAFWLSFVALADLARRSGIEAGQAWIWPLLVDGLIVVATVAAVALDRQRAAWYPWSLLVAGALVSVTANAIHALVAADTDIPALLASAVAAVPPLVLLASTHLTVVLIRSTAPRTVDEPEPIPVPVLTSPAAAISSTEAHRDAEPETSPPAPAEPEPEPETAEPAPEGGSSPGMDRRAEAARLRAVHGWSNKKIAHELQVHPSTVGRWLPRPETDPSADPDASGADSSGPASAETGKPAPNKEATP